MSSWVVAALLLLAVVSGGWYLLAVGASGLLLCLVPHAVPAVPRTGARADLLVIAVLYVGVVALMRLAFVGFSTAVSRACSFLSLPPCCSGWSARSTTPSGAGTPTCPISASGWAMGG